MIMVGRDQIISLKGSVSGFDRNYDLLKLKKKLNVFNHLYILIFFHVFFDLILN